jgi:hypothetical protein
MVKILNSLTFYELDAHLKIYVMSIYAVNIVITPMNKQNNNYNNNNNVWYSVKYYLLFLFTIVILIIGVLKIKHKVSNIMQNV